MELVKHETCQQYVARRLSEGWKIVGRHGKYSLILSPPDGNFLRVVDLRNDVETLRPNAAGDEENIESATSGAGHHHEDVDEAEADGLTTTVFNENTDAFQRDLYNIQNHSVGSGTINFVKVFIVVFGEGGDNDKAKVCIKSGGTADEGSEEGPLSEVWGTYSHQWDTPPEGGSWDWDKIDALQIGVSLQSTSALGGTTVNCTQVYVEVDYTPITPPAVTTLPASAVTSTAARLNGELTDIGGEEPTVHIYWGTSDGGTTPVDWDHDENLGKLGIGTFYKDISGLTHGTKYYCRCYAVNSAGGTWGNTVEFTTLLEKPVAATNDATGVGVSAATLKGTVTDDGGGSCQYRFRYKKAGGDYIYTEWTGAKATGETFSQGITGLDASSTYYFNAQVKNSEFESDWGAEKTFDTGAVVVAPAVTTDPATLVADIEATLNGTVDGDGGEACEVRFQYGLTDAYGTNTAWQPGKLTGNTFSQRIYGLTPNTTYHFRAQIKNSAATVDGDDETFTTGYLPTPFITRVLRDVFGGGADIDLASLLSRLTEASIDSGDATGGSLTTIVDTTKNWEVDKWKDATVEVEVDGVHYYRTVSSNTADTLTIATLPDGHPVASGDHYNIRMALRLADIDKWGGTALTGRDITGDLANLTKLIPIAKAAIFNTALPDAEANWLGSDIEPTNSPSYLRIYACVSVTGILRVARTQDATTVTEDLNSGTALVADAAYMFTVPWRTGDSINIRYSVTTGTIKRLLIDEIGGAE